MGLNIVVAYDVDPYRGSESGSGWNFFKLINDIQPCTLVTRCNNKKSIERYVREFGLNGIKVIYYDLPALLRFWKIGQRSSMVYYTIWIWTVPIFLFYLRINPYKIHYLNFHTDSIPPMPSFFGRKIAWGPINHNELYNFDKDDLSITRELIFRLKVINWKVNPLYLLHKMYGTFFFPANKSVVTRLGLKTNFVILPTIGAKNIRHHIETERITLLVVGRLVPIKNIDLIVDIFDGIRDSLKNEYTDVVLKIIGDGPEALKIKKKIALCKYSKDIQIVGWLDHNSVLDEYKCASIFLSASFEGGGAVIAEAASCGLPIVALKTNATEGLLDGSLLINIGSRESVVNDYVRVINRLITDKHFYEGASLFSHKVFHNNLSWESKKRCLNKFYEAKSSWQEQ